MVGYFKGILSKFRWAVVESTIKPIHNKTVIFTPCLVEYSYQGQDYFFVKEYKTFDEAVSLCRARGQRLVEIKSEAENEFVWENIVKRAGWYTWLGATNELGTKKFKWLADGSYVTGGYTKWYRHRPNRDVNQRNAIFIYYDGNWFDWPVSATLYVLCERVVEQCWSSSVQRSRLKIPNWRPFLKRIQSVQIISGHRTSLDFEPVSVSSFLSL